MNLILRTAAGLILGVAALVAPGGLQSATAKEAPASRYFSSIVWAVMENHGTVAAQKLAAERFLMAKGASFDKYIAVTHPSGPNYRVMVSGETWTQAETYQHAKPTVATELTAVGIPTIDWYVGGRPDLKHDPYLDLKSPITVKTQGPFAPDTLPPAVQVYLGYDDDNNAHDGPMAAVDRNIAALVQTLDNSKWFNRADRWGHYPVLMVTWDESFAPDNAVLTAFYGRGVKPGYLSRVQATHYNFCRTLTDNWGLAALGKAAGVKPIADIWK
jgi:hypothetical protein